MFLMTHLLSYDHICSLGHVIHPPSFFPHLGGQQQQCSFRKCHPMELWINDAEPKFPCVL